MKYSVAIFGECELGKWGDVVLLRTLPEVAKTLGCPTESGLGVHLAIQAMLYEREILFYKVAEEGFSYDEYKKGFEILQKYHTPSLKAIALPGVGSTEILTRAQHLCDLFKSFLILTEKDFYDLMTEK